MDLARANKTLAILSCAALMLASAGCASELDRRFDEAEQLREQAADQGYEWIATADLLEQGAAETVNGATVTLAQLDVAKANIDASNGVIHVLNAVLIPLE